MNLLPEEKQVKTQFDVLVDIITRANPDFAKASLAPDARIECKGLATDTNAHMEKKGGRVYLHLPLKMRVLSKGTKASLILNLGVRTELCVTADQKIGWGNYQFNAEQFPHSVKSSNCDGVADEDLLQYFFLCISGTQFYPFDEEIQALMDFFMEYQDKIKESYEVLTYVPPVEHPIDETPIEPEEVETQTDLLDEGDAA